MNTHQPWHRNTQGYIPKELDPDEEGCSSGFRQFFDTMEKNPLPAHSKKKKKNKNK